MKNKESKRGQIAFEFLIIYGIFLLLFLLIASFVSKYASAQYAFAEQIYLREIGTRVADEIGIASQYSGYFKNISFPKSIQGNRYFMSINGSAGVIVLEYSREYNFTLFYPVLTKNITNGSLDYNFVINVSRGYMEIKNVNGSLVVN